MLHAGLYTSFIPPLMYGILGTCQQMSLGVTAIEAQLCAAGVDSVIGAIGDESIDGTSDEDIAYRIR
jgi:MFS superfamily sulfate permease-like transporter